MPQIGICVKNLTSGGAEKQAVLLANTLVPEHSVAFIIVNGEKVHEKYLKMLSPEVKVVRFEGSRRTRCKLYHEYVKAEALDIIFSYLTAANYYSMRAARGTATKVVTGIRNSKLPLMKHIADALMNRWGVVASVSNCESGKRHFAKTGFKGEKIECIPNCFDPIEEYKKRSERDFVNVITVGRFVAQKDYYTAIKSISRASSECKQLRFTIIGYGELEDKLRNWVKEEGIEDITTILINSNQIAQELSNADIYLSTSLFEGLSNSIMEGMNADLPIVATAVGDNDKLVKAEVNGYITSTGDYKSIAKHIVRLVNDSELRQQMGLKSKELLKANFTKELFAQRYNELITKLLG